MGELPLPPPVKPALCQAPAYRSAGNRTQAPASRSAGTCQAPAYRSAGNRTQVPPSRRASWSSQAPASRSAGKGSQAPAYRSSAAVAAHAPLSGKILFEVLKWAPLPGGALDRPRTGRAPQGHRALARPPAAPPNKSAGNGRLKASQDLRGPPHADVPGGSSFFLKMKMRGRGLSGRRRPHPGPRIWCRLRACL